MSKLLRLWCPVDGMAVVISPRGNISQLAFERLAGAFIRSYGNLSHWRFKWLRNFDTIESLVERPLMYCRVSLGRTRFDVCVYKMQTIEPSQTPFFAVGRLFRSIVDISDFVYEYDTTDLQLFTPLEQKILGPLPWKMERPTLSLW